jgi:hypothetical protein
MAGTIGSLKKKLTLAPLVAATYFMVAGGPYGLEELLHKSGYLLLGVGPAVLLALALAHERHDHPDQLGAVVLGVGLACVGPLVYAGAFWLGRRARNG